MFIPVFNLIIIILLVISFSIFIFTMAYSMGKNKEHKEFYSKLLKHSDEKIISIITTLRKIK
jgi:hypothetical protein